MKTILARVGLWVLLLLFPVLAGCQVPPDGAPPAITLADVLAVATGVSDVVLQVEGTAEVLKRAPHLMPLLDADKDGVIELSDVATFDPRDPMDLLRLYLIFKELRERKPAVPLVAPPSREP